MPNTNDSSEPISPQVIWICAKAMSMNENSTNMTLRNLIYLGISIVTYHILSLQTVKITIF